MRLIVDYSEHSTSTARKGKINRISRKIEIEVVMKESGLQNCNLTS